MDPEYVDTIGAETISGIARATLETWRTRRSDGPPFVKAGRKVLYPLRRLRAWLDARERHSTSSPGSAPDRDA